MGLWVFMFIMDLLFPVIMVIIGHIFKKRTPRNINYLYGYRTTRSMKNKQSWDFAHHYLGKIWFLFGLIFLPLTIVPFIFLINKSEEKIALWGMIIMIIQLTPLIIPVIPTELALKRNFDENGNRRTV